MTPRGLVESCRCRYTSTKLHGDTPQNIAIIFFRTCCKFTISSAALKEIHLDEDVDLSWHFKFYNILLRGSRACFVSEVLEISMLVLLMVRCSKTKSRGYSDSKFVLLCNSTIDSKLVQRTRGHTDILSQLSQEADANLNVTVLIFSPICKYILWIIFHLVMFIRFSDERMFGSIDELRVSIHPLFEIQAPI